VDFAERAAVLASVETPDWESLAPGWPDGHIKLAWTRHLLKLRTELPDVFAHGDYQPLKVTGPHSDHIIAFARRRGRDAVIVAITKSFAPLSHGGRTWPLAATFDGTLHIGGYSVQGIDGKAAASELRLSDLFPHLPVAALKARIKRA
jgi:(1->4)-alpha-D-glucan 1-alpha-D-glucosylmutase